MKRTYKRNTNKIDRRRNVTLTPGAYRLLNDLVKHNGYMGEFTTEETLLFVIENGLCEVIGRGENGRPLVRPTRKGENHQKNANEDVIYGRI